jgi:ribosome-associated translation inhibitor RaiA
VTRKFCALGRAKPAPRLVERRLLSGGTNSPQEPRMDDLQIHFRELAPSPSIEQSIRRHLETIARIHPRITRCRVTVESESRRHRRGAIHRVRLDLGSEIATARHQDPYVAVRDAFEAMRRSLDDRPRRRPRLAISPSTC